MDKAKTIQSTTEDLLSKMISQYSVEIVEDNGVFQIIIKTDADAPTVIGRHGETIRALQKILEVMFYKQFNEPVNILVNVNDYREKQRDRLENIAQQYADQAKQSKTATYVRGLSSFERRIVHEYITKTYPELTSYSVGEGRDRRLVVNLKENEPKEGTEPATTEET